MNILLTSAGRRSYLVRYFKEALGKRGHVFATDLDPNAAALQEADRSFVVPPFNDPGYFDLIREICVQNDVRLLISLNDLELPLLSRKKGWFAEDGIHVLISDPHVIDTCLDKWKAFGKLRDAGIDTPLTFNTLDEAQRALRSGILRYPVFVKPRWGTGSIGIEIARTEEELELAYSLLKFRLSRTILSDISQSDPERSVLIQEMISGEEYGLDIINNLKGEYVTTFTKRKLSMRAGETDKARTVHNTHLMELGEKLGRLFRHVGVMDCDVLSDGQGRMAVLELNPRFGGGYPFSHMAGANIPAAILAWLEGKEPEPEWLQITEGVASAKYDMLTIIANEPIAVREGHKPLVKKRS